MEQSLLDQYCAHPHLAALTSAACDPDSGTRVTADANGTVAIVPPGERYPRILFSMEAPVHGAVAVCPGGSLVAVGDDQGTVSAFKTLDGSCVFEETREGAAGEARAMRALAFGPTGTILASLAVDGAIRVHDLRSWSRVANYPGFGGESLQFDDRGERLLAVDSLAQPKVLDMLSAEIIDLEMVPGGVRMALFTRDYHGILTIGPTGVTLINLADGQIAGSFTARGSSGVRSMVISPTGDRMAAITGRSAHIFELPALQPLNRLRHGAPEPIEAALWDADGVAVGGVDGRLHRPGEKPSLEPIVCCGGFGEHRVAVHGDRVAVWRKNRQKRPFHTKHRFVEIRVDRDGRLLLALPDDGSGAMVFEARTGRQLFSAGDDTADTPKMEVGGSIVACLLSRGGLRWWDLKPNQRFELPWVHQFALSGSGTWLAVTTPRGNVRVLDPATGQDAIPRPEPLAEAPVHLISFINRRPDMLVLDSEGVLGHYDLTSSVTDQKPAVGRDVLQLKVEVDRLWGITGGRLAALRFQDTAAGTATVIFVDLQSGEVVSEVDELLPYVWVDPETGDLLQPAQGSAILELDMHGHEKRVLRALPEAEWIAFGPAGVLEASQGALVP